MRTVVAILFSVVVLVVVLMNVASGFEGTTPQLLTAEDHMMVAPIPDSLDSFYPPTARQPLYLLNMLRLDTSFSGIVVDLMENDLQGARNTYKEFRSQYLEVSNMIPEWKEHYSVAPVDELGAALATGDRGEVMTAFGEVGKICHKCHVSTMVQVQQKYHWGNFGEVRVSDPLTRERTDYSLFKKYLSTNMAGISVNLRQGQTENARKQFQGFKERFQALKESCQNCHEGESKYYVDENIEDLLKKLEQALWSKTVDPEAVGVLVQGVGRESCSKCHLVHVPAALAGIRQQ